VKYDELTDDQKADLATYDKFARGLMASLTTLHRQSGSAEMAQWATDNIDGLLDQIDDTEIIPRATNHAGAKDVTAGEMKQARTIMQQMLGLRQANVSLLVKLVGVNA
jgi:hypothetical protein